MSIASQWVMDVLLEQFPALYGGHTNCRNIGTGSRPSQHAWPNARDLTRADYGYSTDPVNQAYLDEVADYLWENREALSLRALFWRGRSWFTNSPISGHQNHIHIDFWPTGHSTPPCMGGPLRYRYSSGRVVYGDPGPENGINETNDPRPPPPPDDEGDYIMPTLDLWAGYKSEGKGDERTSVRALQIMLAAQGHADTATSDRTCAADGWFGKGTEAAVLSFQRAHGLVADGVCGRLTWAALVAA